MLQRPLIIGIVALAPTLVFGAMVAAARFQDERSDREALALIHGGIWIPIQT